MKNSKKTVFSFIKVLAIVLAFSMSTDMNAITGKRGPHGEGKCKRACVCPDPTPTDDTIPLDGGLSLLVLGAAAFGFRKLRGKKNEKI